MSEFDSLRMFLSKDAAIERTKEGIVEARVGSVGDLVRIVECCHQRFDRPYVYRGQRKNLPLLPQLTRKNYQDAGESWKAKERMILAQFEARAAAYGETQRYFRHDRELAGKPAIGNDPGYEPDLVFAAQHHGVPTRALDFTLNPLAALFFAVEKDDSEDSEKKCDAVVWGIEAETQLEAELNPSGGGFLEASPRHPFFVLPKHSENRAAVQSSVFAIWGEAAEPLDGLMDRGKLWKIFIPAESRPCIKWTLHKLGITRETLFPDLDGLGSYLYWRHKPEGQIYSERGISEPNGAENPQKRK